MFSDHSSTALFLILIIVVGGLGQHKEQPLAYLWTIPTTDTTCYTEPRVTNYGPWSTWHPLPICWLLCSASRARGGMELGTQLRRLLSKWLWNKQVFICSHNDLNYTQQEISAWKDLTRKLKSDWTLQLQIGKIHQVLCSVASSSGIYWSWSSGSHRREVGKQQHLRLASMDSAFCSSHLLNAGVPEVQSIKHWMLKEILATRAWKGKTLWRYLLQTPVQDYPNRFYPWQALSMSGWISLQTMSLL